MESRPYASWQMDTLFKEFDMNKSGDVDDDDVRYLLFSSYIDPKAAKKKYRRVRDLEGLQKTMVQVCVPRTSHDCPHIRVMIAHTHVMMAHTHT